jgi:hypothetical protein
MTCESSLANTTAEGSGEFLKHIFQVKDWGAGQSQLPHLDESNPLSLFTHAGELAHDVDAGVDFD